MIEDKSLGEYMKKRYVFLCFFENNQVLYCLVPQACLGGNAFLSKVEIVKDKLLISSNYTSESRAWYDYQQKFIIIDWTVKNDSTLVGKNGAELKKVRTDLPLVKTIT